MSRINKNSRGFTRRDLLKSAATLGGAALILPAGMHRASAAPKKGGKLRLGVGEGSISDNYDPALWANHFALVFAAARCGYLTELAADGSLVGGIAESWEPSADAITWTFQLRQGVTFHSGKSVTADDVVASINYHRGADSKSGAKGLVDRISDIQAPDTSTVVVKLASGSTDFPVMLSSYLLPILPSADGQINPNSSDGCGGYIVQKYEPGVSAIMTRNPNYWKTDRAHFDEVEILTILDSTARQNALLTGQVDVIDKADRNTANRLNQAPGVKVLSVAGNRHFSFPMDTRATPFSDNNVRLALKYAVDRQELVDKVLGGYGRVGNDHPIGPSNRYYYAELEQHTYDPDKAKFYLRKSGIDSLTVQLHVADAAFSGAVNSAVLYSEKAAAAAINIEVVREPNDGYWNNVWMNKTWCASSWSGRPSEDWMFSQAYAAGASWNDTFWQNARFNELLRSARSELDEAKRREMYYEMQDICSNEGGAVIPMFASYVMGLSDKVAHPQTVGGSWPMDDERLIERWWFA